MAIASVCRADTLDDAARQLAEKVAASLPAHEAIVLNLRNQSSLAAGDIAVVRRTLEAELRSRGVRLATSPGVPVKVRVTLSENLQGYLWVAEFSHGEVTSVSMVALARFPATLHSRAVAGLAIQKELVWKQPEPLLDFALFFASPGVPLTLLVLEPDRLSFYRKENNGWQLHHALPIPHDKPWPRDLRGRLENSGRSVSLYLPSTRCTTDPQQAGSLHCVTVDEGKEWWPLDGVENQKLGARLVADRNFFDQASFFAATPDKEKLPPFFSANTGMLESQPFVVLAGIDGQARAYREDGTLLASMTGWGSEIVGLATECGSGWQFLATRSGDWTEPDAVQAYEIVDGEMVAVSPLMEFPGPVTALWTNGKSARAMVQDLKARRYEAYNLSLSCGR